MANNYAIEVDDKRLQAAVTALQSSLPNYVQAAVTASAEHVRSITSVYPPETEANAPPPPYYRRAVGMITSAAGHVSRASEVMSSKWYVKPSGRTGAEIGNTASYSKFIHGAEKDRVRWAGARGWKSVEDTIKEAYPIIRRLIMAKVKQVWGG
jgi:hypothetical protein